MHFKKYSSFHVSWGPVSPRRFPGDKYSNIVRCIKIAALLADKTVRDVAMRCRWMSVSRQTEGCRIKDHWPTRGDL